MTREEALDAAIDEFDAAYDAIGVAYRAELARINKEYPQ